MATSKIWEMFAVIAQYDLSYSLLWHSTTDWPIVKLLSKGLMTVIRLHCIKNLLNFYLIMSEFVLLKCAIFVAILMQFADDFYLSCWYFETDCKIAILISGQ